MRRLYRLVRRACKLPVRRHGPRSDDWAYSGASLGPFFVPLGARACRAHGEVVSCIRLVLPSFSSLSQICGLLDTLLEWMMAYIGALTAAPASPPPPRPPSRSALTGAASTSPSSPVLTTFTFGTPHHAPLLVGPFTSPALGPRGTFAHTAGPPPPFQMTSPGSVHAGTFRSAVSAGAISPSSMRTRFARRSCESVVARVPGEWSIAQAADGYRGIGDHTGEERQCGWVGGMHSCPLPPL